MIQELYNPINQWAYKLSYMNITSVARSKMNFLRLVKQLGYLSKFLIKIYNQLYLHFRQ